MITFLPFSDFKQTARCLDQKRLGKQRLEALWIVKSLIMTPDDNVNKQPAYQMWAGYENALLCYGQVMCWEWRNRGYEDNQLMEFVKFDYRITSNSQYDDSLIKLPHWLTGPYERELVLNSHRSQLLWKNYAHYKSFFIKEGIDIKKIKRNLAYYWPINNK